MDWKLNLCGGSIKTMAVPVLQITGSFYPALSNGLLLSQLILSVSDRMTSALKIRDAPENRIFGRIIRPFSC